MHGMGIIIITTSTLDIVRYIRRCVTHLVELLPQFVHLQLLCPGFRYNPLLQLPPHPY